MPVTVINSDSRAVVYPTGDKVHVDGYLILVVLGNGRQVAVYAPGFWRSADVVQGSVADGDV